MNDKIKSAYDVALNILNPTKAELEHGLELHKNSLVFDTYGFQPTAAIDGAVVAKAINSNASQLELQDLREDMIMTRYVKNEREKIEFENAWRLQG